LAGRRFGAGEQRFHIKKLAFRIVVSRDAAAPQRFSVRGIRFRIMQ
jgi:hypothetical protein